MARELALTHPDAHTELDFTTPLELIVATILSAQSTDKKINETTPKVFARYPDAAAYAAADRAGRAVRWAAVDLGRPDRARRACCGPGGWS